MLLVLSLDAVQLRAVAVTIFFIACSVGLEVREWDSNFFQKLSVPRGSPKNEFHRAYKK
jgi:hypothetical protein